MSRDSRPILEICPKFPFLSLNCRRPGSRLLRGQKIHQRCQRCPFQRNYSSPWPLACCVDQQLGEVALPISLLTFFRKAKPDKESSFTPDRYARISSKTWIGLSRSAPPPQGFSPFSSPSQWANFLFRIPSSLPFTRIRLLRYPFCEDGKPVPTHVLFSSSSSPLPPRRGTKLSFPRNLHLFFPPLPQKDASPFFPLWLFL